MKINQTIFVWILITALWAITGCGGSSNSDTTKPYVVSTIPANSSAGVARNTQQIEIVFSEAMTGAVSVNTSGGWALSNTTPAQWSNGHTTFSISRDNSSSDLSPNTTIIFTLNPANRNFSFTDLSGNMLDTYTFSFTTGN